MRRWSSPSSPARTTCSSWPNSAEIPGTACLTVAAGMQVHGVRNDALHPRLCSSARDSSTRERATHAGRTSTSTRRLSSSGRSSSSMIRTHRLGTGACRRPILTVHGAINAAPVLLGMLSRGTRPIATAARALSPGCEGGRCGQVARRLRTLGSWDPNLDWNPGEKSRYFPIWPSVRSYISV
jgi:hypothetical protein